MMVERGIAPPLQPCIAVNVRSMRKQESFFKGFYVKNCMITYFAQTIGPAIDVIVPREMGKMLDISSSFS